MGYQPTNSGIPQSPRLPQPDRNSVNYPVSEFIPNPERVNFAELPNLKALIGRWIRVVIQGGNGATELWQITGIRPTDGLISFRPESYSAQDQREHHLQLHELLQQFPSLGGVTIPVIETSAITYQPDHAPMSELSTTMQMNFLRPDLSNREMRYCVVNPGGSIEVGFKLQQQNPDGTLTMIKANDRRIVALAQVMVLLGVNRPQQKPIKPQSAKPDPKSAAAKSPMKQPAYKVQPPKIQPQVKHTGQKLFDAVDPGGQFEPTIMAFEPNKLVSWQGKRWLTELINFGGNVVLVSEDGLSRTEVSLYDVQAGKLTGYFE